MVQSVAIWAQKFGGNFRNVWGTLKSGRPGPEPSESVSLPAPTFWHLEDRRARQSAVAKSAVTRRWRPACVLGCREGRGSRRQAAGSERRRRPDRPRTPPTARGTGSRPAVALTPRPRRRRLLRLRDETSSWTGDVEMLPAWTSVRQVDRTTSATVRTSCPCRPACLHNSSIKTVQQRTIIKQYGDCYTGHW